MAKATLWSDNSPRGFEAAMAGNTDSGRVDMAVSLDAIQGQAPMAGLWVQAPGLGALQFCVSLDEAGTARVVRVRRLNEEGHVLSDVSPSHEQAAVSRLETELARERLQVSLAQREAAEIAADLTAERDEARDRAAALTDDLGALQADFEARLADADRVQENHAVELAALRASLAAEKESHAGLLADREKDRGVWAELRRNVDAERAQVQVLKHELALLGEEHQSVQADREELRARLLAAESGLAERSTTEESLGQELGSQIRSLEASLKESSQHKARVEAELAQVRREAQSAKAGHDSELEALKKALVETQAHVAHLKVQVTTLLADVARLRDAEAAAVAAEKAAQVQTKRVGARLEALQIERAEFQGSAAEWQSQAASASQRADEAVAQAHDARARAEQAESRASAAEREAQDASALLDSERTISSMLFSESQVHKLRIESLERQLEAARVTRARMAPTEAPFGTGSGGKHDGRDTTKPYDLTSDTNPKGTRPPREDTTSEVTSPGDDEGPAKRRP